MTLSILSVLLGFRRRRWHIASIERKGLLRIKDTQGRYFICQATLIASKTHCLKQFCPEEQYYIRQIAALDDPSPWT